LTERELLARREDVWGFLSEPYHLSDWWPGILGVEPDRRGFAPGARWKVRVTRQNLFTGRRVEETLLLVREVLPYELWSWHLLSTRLDVEIRLRASAPDRTVVSISGPRRPERALDRLYDLCQTAAEI
jgi:uncharacterized protein YndB with AHSA1/START domain